MPVPPMFVDPMLGTFRNMMVEVDQKGLTGANVDAMRATLGRMEGLAQECNDINEFSGRLTQEQCFQKFSDAYGRALADAAKPSGGGGAPQSDEQMLDNMVSSYEQTLQVYRSGQAGEEGTKLIPIVERIVELGRSGVSFPVYLRMLEEQGLNRALDGAAVVVRPALEAAVAEAAKWWYPYKYAEAQAQLAVFDELAAKAPFGQPDSFELSLRFRHLEWDYAPKHAWWDALTRRWQYIIDKAFDWVDSFTSFAPYDERWASQGGNMAVTKKNIKRTQETEPGNFQYRNAILQRYFGLTIDHVWTHDTFTYEYTARRVELSDARLQLVRETIPHMVPGGRPPAELIQRAEQLHGPGDYREDRNQPLPPGSAVQNPFLQR